MDEIEEYRDRIERRRTERRMKNDRRRYTSVFDRQPKFWTPIDLVILGLLAIAMYFFRR